MRSRGSVSFFFFFKHLHFFWRKLIICPSRKKHQWLYTGVTKLDKAMWELDEVWWSDQWLESMSSWRLQEWKLQKNVRKKWDLQTSTHLCSRQEATLAATSKTQPNLLLNCWLTGWIVGNVGARLWRRMFGIKIRYLWFCFLDLDFFFDCCSKNISQFYLTLILNPRFLFSGTDSSLSWCKCNH